MTKKERVKEILSLLDKYYPTETKCFLNHQTDYELLIATILSAQCTDDRVNIVTKSLFQKYKTLEDFYNADINELTEIIKSTGLYRSKAKNILATAKKLYEEYDSKVPSDISDLISLPGVGRKTANVVRGHIFNIPSIVVDTHVKRISIRWGFVKSSDPEKIEFELMKILPKKHWIKYNTQVIAHGRKICTARSPKCDVCFIEEICPKVLVVAL